jgi:hypothetical protein
MPKRLIHVLLAVLMAGVIVCPAPGANINAGLVYYTNPNAAVQALVAQRYECGITGVDLRTCDEVSLLHPGFKWYAYNSVSDNYATGPEQTKIEAVAALHGWSPEIAYLHFWDDTTINTGSATITIPGFGGGSATTLAQARVPFYAAYYANPATRRIAVNFSTPQSRQLSKEVALALSVDATFATSTLHPDGIFFDNCANAGYKTGTWVSGGHVLESPAHAVRVGLPAFDTWYWQNGLRPFLSAVKDTLATLGRGVVINVASYWSDDYLTYGCGSIVFMEFNPNPITAPGVDKPLEMWRRDMLAESKSIRLWYSPSASTCYQTSCHTYADAFVGGLAYYLTTKTAGSIWFHQATGSPSAAGWDTLTWRGVVAVVRDSLGDPTGPPYVIQQGHDDSPGHYPYKITARPYRNGLVLLRPRGLWNEDIDNDTAIAVDAGEAFRRLDVNGVAGAPARLVSMRNGDGAILLKSGTPPPPPPPPTVCDIRGHVLGEAAITTLPVQWSLLDLPERSLLIRTNPNTVTGTCLRCGMTVTQPAQTFPDTTVIWP